jgi:hypothetical protein
VLFETDCESDAGITCGLTERQALFVSPVEPRCPSRFRKA